MKVKTSLWKKTDHLAVAVSTGIDSMCLLYKLLNDLSHSYQSITCLHVNHGLRDASVEEERFIKQFCKQHQIPCYVKQLDLSKIVEKGKSIQSEARDLRYQWFDEMMSKINADVLLTAHHLNDQLETIFYRVFTGRSTRNSLGMNECTERNHYFICRPLIETYKNDIKQYQTIHHVPFYEDESNHHNKYARNDIRNRLLPAIDENKDFNVEQLLKLKHWHDIQLQLTQQRISCFIEQHVNIYLNKERIQLSRASFNQLDEISKMILLDRLFEMLQLNKSFSEKNYNEWFEQIESKQSQIKIPLTEKWIIQIAYDKFIIMAHYEQSLLEEQIVTRPYTYQFGHYLITIHPNENDKAIDWPLTIRTRRDGDKFKLNGSHGHKKVSRLFIDKKIDSIERTQIPIILDAKQRVIAIGQLYVTTSFKHIIDIKKIGDDS